MQDQKDRATRVAAADRADEYRRQAEAFRRLAGTEPLEQRRRLLERSAAKYDEAAEAEERIAYGRRREVRHGEPAIATERPAR